MSASTETTTARALSQYTQAYQRLYKRTPKELRALDEEWVIVNGARMRVNDLAYLTRQLQREYEQGQASNGNVVRQFLKLLKP